MQRTRQHAARRRISLLAGLVLTAAVALNGAAPAHAKLIAAPDAIAPPGGDDRIDNAVSLLKRMEERGIIGHPQSGWDAPEHLADGVTFKSEHKPLWADCPNHVKYVQKGIQVRPVNMDASLPEPVVGPDGQPWCKDPSFQPENGERLRDPHGGIKITVVPRINTDAREDRGNRAIYLSNDTARVATVSKGDDWFNFTTVLEDEYAPTYTEYDIKLPAPYKLSVLKDGRLGVRHKETRDIARIIADPWAQDWDRTALVTSFDKVDRNTIRQDVVVPRDAVYPIAVDPEIYYEGWPISYTAIVVYSYGETQTAYDMIDIYGDISGALEYACGLIATGGGLLVSGICWGYIHYQSDAYADTIVEAAESGECALFQYGLLPIPAILYSTTAECTE